MPVLLSIIILLCDRTLIIDSIPKLGHILSDPLSNEAKVSGKDIKNIMVNVINNSFHDTSTEERKDLLISSKFNLRKSENTESTQSPSYGYNFNDTICKTVDERIICGYDKNLGTVDTKIVDLGNGCRIRGDRLECGYLVGPFNNPRRPPVSDSDNEHESKNKKLSENTPKLLINKITTRNSQSTVKLPKLTRKKNTKNSTIATEASTNKIDKLSKNITTTLRTKPGLTTRSITFTSSYTNKISSIIAAVTVRNKRHCVEKNDSIFCYSIKKPN